MWQPACEARNTPRRPPTHDDGCKSGATLPQDLQLTAKGATADTAAAATAAKQDDFRKAQERKQKMLELEAERKLAVPPSEVEQQKMREKAALLSSAERQMAEELDALGMEYLSTNPNADSMLPHVLPDDQVINRARQAGDAKLSVLCDAVGCTTDDLVRAAERIQRDTAHARIQCHQTGKDQPGGRHQHDRPTLCAGLRHCGICYLGRHLEIRKSDRHRMRGGFRCRQDQPRMPLRKFLTLSMLDSPTMSGLSPSAVHSTIEPS